MYQNTTGEKVPYIIIMLSYVRITVHYGGIGDQFDRREMNGYFRHIRFCGPASVIFVLFEKSCPEFSFHKPTRLESHEPSLLDKEDMVRHTYGTTPLLLSMSTMV